MLRKKTNTSPTGKYSEQNEGRQKEYSSKNVLRVKSPGKPRGALRKEAPRGRQQQGRNCSGNTPSLLRKTEAQVQGKDRERRGGIDGNLVTHGPRKPSNAMGSLWQFRTEE